MDDHKKTGLDPTSTAATTTDTKGLATTTIFVLLLAGALALSEGWALVGVLPSERASALELVRADVAMAVTGGREETTMSLTVRNLGPGPASIELFLPLDPAAGSFSVVEAAPGGGLRSIEVRVVPAEGSGAYLKELVRRLVVAGRCSPASCVGSALVSCASLLDHAGSPLYIWQLSLGAGEERDVTVSYERAHLPVPGPAVETYLVSVPASAAKFWHGPVGELSVSLSASADGPGRAARVTDAPEGATHEGGSASLRSHGVRPWDDLAFRYELVPRDVAERDVAVRVVPSRAVVAAGRAETVYVLFEVEGRGAAAAARRLPMDVALVVDTSGSMSGQKLADARRAALLALERLPEGDSVVLVPFSDSARLISGTRSELSVAVSGLSAGGSTNLHSALELAIGALASLSTDRLRAVFVLTDGMPTAGVTDEDRIAGLGERAGGLGIAVTTIGFGADVNARLLRRIAESSGGGYRYSEDADFLGSFEGELRGASSSAATDVALSSAAGERASLVAVHGAAASVSGRAFTVALHSVRTGARASFEVEVRLPALEAGERAEAVAGSILSYRGADGEPVVISLPPVTVVASDNAKDVEEDISVVARAELDRAADLTYAAEASLAAGDLNATAGTLGGVLAVHERLRSLGLGWDGSVAAQQAAVLGMQQQAWSGTRASQAAQNSATTATYAIRNLDPEAMLRSRRRAAGQSLSQVEGLWLTNERLQDRVRGRRVAVVYGRRADGLDRQGAEELAQALEASGADARVAADDEVAGPGDGEAYVLVGGPAANSQVRALPPEHDWYLLNRGGRGAAYVAGDALVVAGAEREDTLAAARLVAALLMQA